MATNQVAHLGIKVSAKGVEKAKAGIKGIGNVAKRVKDQIFSLNGAMGALGAGAVMKSVIKSASGLESLKVRLKFLTGSVQDAGKAFDTMTGFASKVPFALEDIQKASPLLLTVTDDIDELNGLLEMTGDIAAVSGLDFVKTAEQLQRAMAGGIASADLFRERGVAAFLGFEQGVQMSGEETSKALKEMWENNTTTAVGATKELAKTFQGQVSMMEDAWFKLKIQFADTGIFQMAKDVVLDITESLGKPENINAVKEFGKGVVSVGKAMGVALNALMGLPPWILEVGVVMAFLGGKKAKLVVAGIAALSWGIGELGKAISEVSGGAKKPTTELVDIFGEGNEKVRAWRYEIKKLGDQAKILRETGMFDGQAVEAKDQQQILNALSFSMAQMAQQAEELKTRLQALRTPLDDVTVSTKTEVFNVYDFAKGGEADSRLKKFTKTMDSYKNSILKITNVMTPLQKLEKERDDIIERFNEAYRNGIILDVEKASGIKEVNSEYQKAVKFMEDAKIEEVVQKLAQGMEDSITDAIMGMTNGLNSFKDIARSVFNEILSHFIRMQVVKPLLGMFGMGGGFTGNLSSVVNGVSNNMAVAGFASGGRPPVGRASLVGEKGAELFIPDRAGTVVPNHQLNTSTGEVRNVTAEINFNVQAIDASSFNNYLVNNRGTIEGIINASLVNNGSVRRTVKQVI